MKNATSALALAVVLADRAYGGAEAAVSMPFRRRIA
jgi:hypothetical protein